MAKVLTLDAKGKGISGSDFVKVGIKFKQGVALAKTGPARSQRQFQKLAVKLFIYALTPDRL